MISIAKQQVKHTWILLLFLVATFSGIILLSAQTFVKTFRIGINMSLHKVDSLNHPMVSLFRVYCYLPMNHQTVETFSFSPPIIKLRNTHTKIMKTWFDSILQHICQFFIKLNNYYFFSSTKIFSTYS